MTPNALRCIHITTSDKVEGGFTKRADDPGNWTSGKVGQGLLRGTKRGVSAGRYPTLDIEHLTDNEIDDLYYKDYWLKFRCDQLPLPIAMMLFDSVVTSNPTRPIMWLQTALGVTVDGAIGQHTVDAANQAPNVAAVINEMAAQRASYLHGLKDAGRNPGWFPRVEYIKNVSLEMIQ